MQSARAWQACALTIPSSSQVSQTGSHCSLQQRHQVRLLLLDLIESALFRRLVGTPAQQTRAVPKALAREIVIATLDHELRLQRLPFARALRRPAAGPSRRVAAKAGRGNQSFEFFGERRFFLPFDRRGKPDMVQETLVI